MKLHKIICLILMQILLSSMIACSRDAEAETKYVEKNVTLQETEKNLTYTLKVYSDRSHEKSSVEISYPEFIKGENANEKVNGRIKSYVQVIAESYYGADYKNLDMHLDFKVHNIKDGCVSIEFSGYGNVITAAHPNKIIRGLTIDSYGNVLKLTDVVTIDESFISLVKNCIKDNTNENMYKYLEDKYFDKIEKYFLVTGEPNGEVQYNILNESLVLYFSVTHAMGDYVEISIPYRITLL